MKIKGSAQIWAVNNNSGALTDYREVDNLIFDISRPYLVFYNETVPNPVLDILRGYSSGYPYTEGVPSIYLSSGVCVDQTSFDAIVNGTRWDPNYPLIIGDKGKPIVPVSIEDSYETVSFMEHERAIFSTLAFTSVDDANIINSLGIGFKVEHYIPPIHYQEYHPITCASVSPPIAHTIDTTVFVHYVLDVSLEDDPYMFGREVIRRIPASSLPYFGNTEVSYPDSYLTHVDCNFYVGMPFYKKYFYVSNLTTYAPSYGHFQYIFPSHYDIPVSPWIIYNRGLQYEWGTFIIPQASIGPYGGVYEGRNSSLGVALISDSHISRIFQHVESASSLLFYDPSETDVPEGDGVITIDISSLDLDDPTAYKIRIISSGDVGEAEYKVVKYLGTSSNILGLGALYRSAHSIAPYSASQIRIRASHMYVSQNREWSAHRLSLSRIVAGDPVPLTYLYIRYKEGVRYILNNVYDNYAIQGDGICYVSYAASPTCVYSIDGNEEKPGYVTETLEFDLAVEFPSQGITSIRGLTIDEDLDYLWVATNNCFVRVSIGTSGGSGFELFDHNTPSFGEYCTSGSVVLYNAFNGRFQAENGTLTWVPNDFPGSVFHWTGDRAARSCASGMSYVLNLMQDLSLGYICIMRCNMDSLGSPFGSQMYPQVLKIGVASITIQYSSILPVGYLYYVNQYSQVFSYAEAFSMCVDDGFFLFASPSPTVYLQAGNQDEHYIPESGVGVKGRIDLTTFVETRESFLGQPFVFNGKQTPNRSLIRGCLSISLERGQWVVLSLDQEYGWDGASWVLGHTSGKLTHADLQELPNGVGISFSDALGDFRSGEYYSFGVNPHGLYKDNLETLTIYGCYYSGKVIIEEKIIRIPLSCTYEITEKTDPDFLCMNGWKYCSHSRAIYVDEEDIPYGDPLEIVDVTPTSIDQVQFTDIGNMVFYAGGSKVKIRYVWVSKV